MEISVIIPCYNVEQYIDRCLKSVMEQTIGLDMYEVILVNDASTDGTLEKLYEWEEKYPENIMVVTYEENIRQGGARNVGFQYSRGKYISYVDADDWIELDMLECFYEKMSTGKYDVVKGKFVREKTETPLIVTEKRNDVEYHFATKNGLCYGIVEESGNCGTYGGVFGLYKKELLTENNVFFPEKTAYEDNFWGSILRLYVKDLYIVDKVVYHYFVNPTSTVMAVNAKHHFDRLEIEVLKVEEFKKRGAFDLFYREIEWDFLQLFYLNTWHIFFTKFTYIPDIYGKMKKTILDLFPDYLNNPYLELSTPRQKQLIRMLSLDRNFTVEDLKRIKKAYLAV